MAEYIKKSDAWKAVEAAGEGSNGFIADEFEKIPSADVAEVRHGKWENDGIDRIGSCEIRWLKCSECGYAFTKIPIQPLNKYCLNCGARMDGE